MRYGFKLLTKESAMNLPHITSSLMNHLFGTSFVQASYSYKLAAIYEEDSWCFRLSATWAITPTPALWSHSFFTWIQTAIWVELKQEIKTPKKEMLNEIRTWMLLWAKKGQNAEWKLTSTFFHPNCCKPCIISSVNRPNT